MFWVLLGAMFLANWFIAAQARNIGTHPRLTVPSSYFRAQSQAGNIDEVNSQGETIQGSFRHVITYPAGKRGQVTHPFKTERPASADDQLLQILVSENVAMNAKPITTGTSLVSEMLLAFGPTLLPSRLVRVDDARRFQAKTDASAIIFIDELD